MARLRGAYTGAVFNQLERLFHHGTSTGLTEGELVERFVTGRDETAFEALVARHGRMVLGVCRQLLRDPNDVDDAFQATFLILVRKADTLRRCDLLGNWLYGVAYRVAARARRTSARRTARIAPAHGGIDVSAAEDCRQNPVLDCHVTSKPEPAPWLHHEVSHLPEKYRVPILLCYFEGLTHEEAAKRLGWPLGTVKGRLARARDLLRKRLLRRGVTLSATALISHLTLADARAAVPASLQLATFSAARALACSTGTSLVALPAVALTVASLVEGVLQAMMIHQVKSLALAALFVVGTVATGVVVTASQLSGQPGNGGAGRQPASAAANQADPRDLRPTAKALQPAPNAQKSLSPALVQQLRAAGQAFDDLLSSLRDASLEDIDRLSNWSNLTREAEVLFATNEVDRQAAAEAHRDRMRQLYERIEHLPVSDNNRQIKLARADSKLEAAKSLLEAGTHATDARGGSLNAMGSQTGMMRGRTAQGRMIARMGGPAEQHMGSAPGAGQRSETSQTKSRLPVNAAGGAANVDGATGGMGGGYGGMDPTKAEKAAKRVTRLMIAETAMELAVHDTNPKDRMIFTKLDEPISMSFPQAFPLEDVLKYIKQATTTKTYAGLPIYVDPIGLAEAEKSMTSTISNMDLEGVPLKITLKLLLRQLELAYCVGDGMLMISSEQGISEALEEAKCELNKKEDMEAPAGADRSKKPGGNLQ